MEFKLITDKSEWNNFVSSFSYTTLFLSWEWSQFELSIGSKFETWGVYDQNHLVGIFPLKTIYARRGKYVHVRHAPLLDWSNLSLVSEVMGFLKKYAHEKKAHFIRISPLLPNTSESNEILTKLGFNPSVIHETDAELTIILNLTKPENELLGEMRKTTRNLIRKGEKLGIVVKHATDFELFEDFTKVYLDTVKRQQWNAYSTNYIEKEYRIFCDAGKADMFVAYYQNKPLAAAVFIRHEKQIIYHFGGSVTEFRDIPSAYLLHWEAIKLFKSEGYSLYNFWGVSPADKPKHPWYGLSLFKRGFSVVELSFVHSQDLDLKPFAKLTHIFELIESVRRGYRSFSLHNNRTFRD